MASRSSTTYTMLTGRDAELSEVLTQSAKLLSAIHVKRISNRRALTQEVRGMQVTLGKLSMSSPVRKDLETRISKITSNMQALEAPTLRELSSHVSFLNTSFSPYVECVFDFSRQNINEKPAFGGECVFAVPITRDCFISEQAIRIKLSELIPTSPEDSVRYADMVGHRLIKNVQLFINNKLVDEYDGELYNVHYDAHVPLNKKAAWRKCIGQSGTTKAETVQDPENNLLYEHRELSYGYQTIKHSQPEMELFIPLLFWFNSDKADSLYVSKDMKIEIKVQLSPEKQLMTCVDVYSDIYNEKYQTPRIVDMELYTNHIYFNPAVMALFHSRVNISLIRVNRMSMHMLDTNKGRIVLDNIKHLVERLTIYARPKKNEDGIDSLNTWNKNSIQTLKRINIPVIYQDPVTNQPQIGVNNIKYYESTPLFECVDVLNDTCSYFGEDSHLFYSAYIPLISKGLECGDQDMYHMTYGYDINSHQPSGALDLTKQKLVFTYSSSLIEDNSPVVLYVHARTINFLVHTGTSAGLRYL